MSLFKKKRPPAPPAFPAERFEPVLRCSICTGEQTACFRDRASGALHEVTLLRSGADLEAFCRDYGVKPEDIKKIY